ncbi:MAG TPA: hypothetical protein VLA16_10175 [Ideonella sp.]|nr:hypothetical protein [Ideonella sp.]
MIDLTTQLAEWAFRNVRTRAVLFGAGLGWLTWGLSMVPERSAFSVAMALVMLVAGAVSFVLHALHELLGRGGLSRGARAAEVRLCTSLLGGGIAASLYALQALYP